MKNPRKVDARDHADHHDKCTDILSGLFVARRMAREEARRSDRILVLYRRIFGCADLPAAVSLHLDAHLLHIEEKSPCAPAAAIEIMLSLIRRYVRSVLTGQLPQRKLCEVWSTAGVRPAILKRYTELKRTPTHPELELLDRFVKAITAIGPRLTRESILRLPDDLWIEIAGNLEFIKWCRAKMGGSAGA